MTSSAVSGPEIPALTGPAQIVTFRIADRLFGVDVDHVREIKGWQQTTPLPDAPSHVLGVINLRGQIVPVHDMRPLLGLDPADTEAGKVVLVLDIDGSPCGIVASAVSDILDVTQNELRAVPTTDGSGVDVLSGLVVKGDSVIALLNVGAVTGDRRVRTAH